MEPPAGAAPARLSYKGSLQAAARRRNGLPSRSSERAPQRQPPAFVLTDYGAAAFRSALCSERRLVAVPSAALGAAGV